MNLTACAPETPTWTRHSSQSLDRSIPWHCRPARRLTRRRPWAGECRARKRAISRPTSNPSLKSISSLSRLSLIRAHLRYLWNWWGCARSALFPPFRPQQSRHGYREFRGEGSSGKRAILTWPDVGRDARRNRAQRAAAEVATLTSRRAEYERARSRFDPLICQ